MVKILETRQTIAVSMDKTYKLVEQAQLISVAQAFGKNNILESLLLSMSSSE